MLVALAIVRARPDADAMTLEAAQQLGKTVVKTLADENLMITRPHLCSCNNAATWHRACNERDRRIAVLKQQVADLETSLRDALQAARRW